MSKFEIHDLGEPKSYLGIQVNYNPNECTLKLHQTQYAQTILDRFRMSHSKPTATPLVTTKTDPKNPKLNSDIPYRSIVVSLMYLANGTHPDLTFAVNYLSHFQRKPTEEHYRMLKQILRYLNGTVNKGLVYHGKTNVMIVHTDADFASDVTDCKSTSGIVIHLYGDLIVWSSHKQDCTTLSTTEAEYVAISEGLCDAKFVYGLTNDLLENVPRPITLFEDNVSAICLAKKQENKKTKHFDVKYHFICSEVECKFVTLKYTPSVNQLADILTKPLGKMAFQKFRDALVTNIRNEKRLRMAKY